MNKEAELDRQIHNFLKKYDPKYKAEIIRVNISQTFLNRARCSKCGKHPSYYYYVRRPYLWRDIGLHISASKWFRQWINRMTSDWYLSEAPKLFPDIQEFFFALKDMHYLPDLFQMRSHLD